jgi:hypothetical protein
MRRSLVLLFILGAAPALAQTPARQQQTITSVSPTTGTFTAAAGNVNTPVFTATATMSPSSPAFSGNWAIRGPDGNKFNINAKTGVVTICNTKPSCTDLLSPGPFNVTLIARQYRAIASPFTQAAVITATQPAAAADDDGLMSEAPYGGALDTQFGSYTWGDPHPQGGPTYYLLLDGTQVDAGDLVQIANDGNVYLLYGADWYGPWDPTTHFGANPNLAIHLPTIKFEPQTTSALAGDTPAGTFIAMIIGKNADGSTYGGNYSMLSEGKAVILGNRIVAGAGAMIEATHIRALEMTSPGIVAQTSAAPSGPNISNSSGTWSWGAATANRPGDYDVLLNGTLAGSGNLVELVSGIVYVNTVSAGWYVYNTAEADFNGSTNPNGS